MDPLLHSKVNIQVIGIPHSYPLFVEVESNCLRFFKLVAQPLIEKTLSGSQSLGFREFFSEKNA